MSIETSKSITNKEWLQAFLKKKPLRTSQVRLKGHKKQGMAAGIPKKKALKDMIIETQRA